MSASFQPDLARPLDVVRFRLGDTDVSDALLPDQTIQALLDRYTIWKAIAEAARALITRFSQQPDELSRDGDVSLKWGSRIEEWHRLAQEMDAKDAAIGATSPGISIGQMTSPDTSWMR